MTTTLNTNIVTRPVSPKPSATGRLDPGADFLSLSAFSREALRDLVELSALVKANPARFAGALSGTSVALLFEKASLRTRAAFEVGINKLGGHSVYFDHNAGRLGERETVSDYAKNLERWFGLIVARTYRHDTIEKLAAASAVPVINALSDASHPCQALADTLTLVEHLGGFDALRGQKVAFVGDGNNVCVSFARAMALCGCETVVISPEGYGLAGEIEAEVRETASANGGGFASGSDVSLVRGARAVYTDVWVSMGHEESVATRTRAFEPYRVDSSLISRAADDALFLHCLPAKRGLEVTDEVIDGLGSVVFDQAENRMHTQNAVLLRQLGKA